MTEKLYTAVMVGGHRQELDNPMSGDKIKDLLESYGVATNLDSATPTEVSPGVLEFMQPRGVNGL